MGVRRYPSWRVFGRSSLGVGAIMKQDQDGEIHSICHIRKSPSVVQREVIKESLDPILQYILEPYSKLIGE